MAAEDAERLLEPLREAAHSHNLRAPITEEERTAIRRVARLLIERPGVSSRHLIMAVEEAAHEAHPTAGTVGGQNQ